MITPLQPGYALLALKGGRQALRHCSGVANADTGEMIIPATNFRMASVSKQFTAMTIRILADQSALRLSDTIGHFFPDTPPSYRGISLEQLLTHTSGIADYEPLIPEDQETQILDADAWELVKKSGELYFKPGSAWRYSNMGYCLLSLVAERAGGADYPSLAKQLIFDPLDMRRSSVYLAGREIPNRAMGYAWRDGSFIPRDQSITSAAKGDGGVYTSLQDYTKWHQALYTEDLLPRAQIREVLSPLAPVANGVGYGHGWFSGKEEDGTACVFHSGETSGFLNIVYHRFGTVNPPPSGRTAPRDELLIAVFTNRTDNSVSGLFERAAEDLDVKVALKGYETGSRPALFNWLSEQY